jgi:hypothetical protein
VRFALPLLVLLLPATASAVTAIIGDPDGFGIDPAGRMRADDDHTNPADVDGDGILEAGEYLPDWDLEGRCIVGGGDFFDLRDGAELAASDGAQWTDHAIEGNGSADGATFSFSFPVPAVGDLGYGSTHFVTFVFGDYDVTPAEVVIDGEVVELERQDGPDDGLIQATFAAVPWTALTDGALDVVVSAPNEPYLAFDYALLARSRSSDTDGDGIPDAVDVCPEVPSLDQADADGDGVGDACDLCPDVFEPWQEDRDGDGAGDACDPCPEDPTDDGDADGFCAPDDCAEGDPAVHPDAPELCDDGVDNDCDGEVDVLPDVDADGFSPCEGDCDEGDGSVFPGAAEVCEDAVDQDCDGLDLPCPEAGDDDDSPGDDIGGDIGGEGDPTRDPGVYQDCSCDAGGSGGPLLLFLLGLRRRR